LLVGSLLDTGRDNRQLVTAGEMERGRIARELHEGALQDLCAVTAR
jgi:signal transduction histidine kinase